jgi:hypothetical protein
VSKIRVNLLRRPGARFPEVDRGDNHAIEVVGEVATEAVDAPTNRPGAVDEDQRQADLHREQRRMRKPRSAAITRCPVRRKRSVAAFEAWKAGPTPLRRPAADGQRA